MRSNISDCGKHSKWVLHVVGLVCIVFWYSGVLCASYASHAPLQHVSFPFHNSWCTDTVVKYYSIRRISKRSCLTLLSSNQSPIQPVLMASYHWKDTRSSVVHNFMREHKKVMPTFNPQLAFDVSRWLRGANVIDIFDSLYVFFHVRKRAPSNIDWEDPVKPYMHESKRVTWG